MKLSNLFPTGVGEISLLDDTNSSSRKVRATVFFRDPRPGLREKGYAGATFDIEYQLMACMGELHIAYNIVQDSVRQARPGYLLDGTYYEPELGRFTALSLPLVGTVYHPPFADTGKIGDFSDGAAGEALGFGCFTGQTKPFGKVSDHLPANYTPAQLKAFLDGLEVSFETREILTSGTAEDWIRQYRIANRGAAPINPENEPDYVRAAREREAAERLAAEEAAERQYRADTFAAEQRRAQELADKTAAETRAYQEGLARYESELEIKRAADEKFARDMAAFEAEQQRIAAERAEYERRMEEWRRAVGQPPR